MFLGIDFFCRECGRFIEWPNNGYCRFACYAKRLNRIACKDGKVPVINTGIDPNGDWTNKLGLEIWPESINIEDEK